MRSKITAAVASAAVAGLLLTACGGGGDNGPAEGATGDTTPTVGAPLTIAKPDGAITTENNNPWLGDSSANKLGYKNVVFEPLAFVNPVGKNETTPMLAEKVEWNDDYTQVRLTPRAGVTWNDGEEFTADDIVFTFNLIKDTPALDTGNLQLTEVAKDGDDVVLSFGESKFVKQAQALHVNIVPEHIWKDVEDPTTFANDGDPVGTGPYVLESFTSQSVTMTARDDYWGGDLAVPTLYYVSYNDNTALTTALANGDADWAQAFISNIENAYLDKDPEHNVFWAANVMAPDVLFVNHQKKPFSDLAFRKAVNMVIDRPAHTEIARENAGPVLTSVTGLPTPVGEQYIASEYEGAEFSMDVDGARKVLEDAGYTWDGDTLIDPDGETVTFTLQVPQGWNDYVTGISLIADQVSKTLGADAKVDTPDVDTWWAAKRNGDFDAIMHWTDSGTTPYDLYSDTMDGRWLLVGDEVDYNFGRYIDDEATALLNTYATSSSDEERTAALDQIQKIFVEQVPVIPVGTHPVLGEYNTRNYVGWPNEDDQYATADPLQVSVPLILTKLKPAS
ncbi:extracellular solute-binding protein family 5 [Xylanimonas cellulosilytica DSM 15894]|uniref:Extracellular solute-binding protein family 5 n=1 Tax=Xylanimonas cellulosilytica (strain DSM 15894 / JCM 12276 / CECT 5975 / KCTC 9989 / LMG 20990 / NBRC 107835 / XIL07) TaxID=446471 RepID=D1BYN9_XYLCX|nr:ABC transporter substrate-binding protein [Xylanimonas cellulosilytica]ACZ29964.1 extracellular solute-binding protein family 5 [Xylanimonas cellulosilytica DSM 15894]